MGSPPRKADSETLYAVSVFAVFILALLVRMGGIWGSEPFMPHPDEAGFVLPALRILATGDLNPHWFGHPGGPTIYGLSAVYGLAALLRNQSLSTLPALYAQDPEPFHVLGRQLIVVCSMLSHLGLWLLARRFTGRWGALLAVLLLACAPLDIKLSGCIRTDTQQSALLLLLCVCLVSAVRSGSLRAFVASGFVLGLATAVKWPSVSLCGSIVLASYLSARSRQQSPFARRELGNVAAAAVASLAGLFVLSPYVFLDFGTVLGDVTREARSYHMSATSPGFFPALGSYAVLSLWDLRLPALVLALLGVMSQFRSPKWREHAVIVSVFVVYLLFISAQSLRWSRWAVPLLPYPCLWAALGAKVAVDFVRQRVASPRSRAGIVVTACALLLACSTSSVVSVLEQRARDPAGELFAWVSAHIPAKSKILTEKDTPPLPKELFDVRVVDRKSGKLERARKSAKYSVPTGTLMDLKDADAVLKVDYVILGNRYRRVKAEPERQRRALRTYDAVAQQTELVKQIGPYQIRRVKKQRR